MSTWNRKASKGGDGNFERAPAGNHPAVLIGLIDMGTQENNFQGNVTWQHRAYFVYELVNEKMQTAPGRNFILAVDLTVSMNEKAKLRKWIEARTGKQIPDGVEYDISQELGQPVLLNVVLNKDGYPKIESVGSVPRGMNVAKPQNTPTTMTLDEFRAGAPVPSFCPYLYGEPLANVIKRAQEITGKGLPPQAPPAGSAPPPPPPPAPAVNGRDGSADYYWVMLETGKAPYKLTAADAGREILSKGLTPETVMACKDGTQAWAMASTFGITTPF